MRRLGLWSMATLTTLALGAPLLAAEPMLASLPAADGGDTAWMLISTALVMLMVPGLALFYCGMVRRKNVLATMMHSMVALAIVGVYWVAIGYALAFGDPWLTTTVGDKTLSFLGWSPELVLLKGVRPDSILPNSKIPVYLHMAFQGMFAIITPALISGALAERIRFKPYCAFLLVWVTFVYCPLAHMVWAMDWNWKSTLVTPEKPDLESEAAKKMTEAERTAVIEKFNKEVETFNTTYGQAGKSAVGYLGAKPSLDFAGGTVVHIAAGFSSLAAFLVLRRRYGYPEHAFHPNSMVLTLTGAGILWFGWFGFNGGSASGSGTLATSAFLATQLAAAGAGLTWLLVEWIHRGKPTALGLASGIVAGLVAVTPASGYILPHHGLYIGLIAGVVCYGSVLVKSKLGYDDSLDAFGVHGVGGFLGAVLTGFFCSKLVNSVGEDASSAQVYNQVFGAVVSAVIAFVGSLVIVKIVDLLMGFTTTLEKETQGLDQSEHGESGFDYGLATEAVSVSSHEPRPAALPPNGIKHFSVVVDGLGTDVLAKTWSELCQPSEKIPSEFRAIYPFMTTVQGNRFRFRGGESEKIRESLHKLLEARSKQQVKTKIEA